MDAFFARLEQVAANEIDVPCATALEPGSRWNGLINAISTYISGAEWDRVSAKDFDRYGDSGVNWRVVEGLGSVVAAAAQICRSCSIVRCAASITAASVRESTTPRRDRGRSGHRDRPERAAGEGATSVHPGAAGKNPGGAGAPAWARRQALHGARRCRRVRKRRARIRTYRSCGDRHVSIQAAGTAATSRAISAAIWRPSSRRTATAHFSTSRYPNWWACSAMTFARRLKPIRIHRWGLDPFALGAYSYALPGFADCRSTLAAPVEDRLFFAGEACSTNDFSTAHGAWLTGIAAADQVIAARLA